MMGRTHSVHAEPTTLGAQARGLGVRGRRAVGDAAGGRRRPTSRPARSRGPVGTYSHLAPDLEADVLADARACASTRSAPRSSSAIVTRRSWRRSPSSAARSSASRPRSGTSSTPRSPRSWSRSEAARRAARRCPTSATPSCPSGSPGLPGSSAATPRPRLENQPLWHERDISHSSAERVVLPDATILLDYMLVKMAGLIEGLVVRRRAHAREHRAGAGPPREQPGAAGARRGRRAVARGGVRDRPARRRCAPPTSACRCSACWRPTPSSAGRLSLAALDACFDDAGVRPPRARRSSPGSTRSRRVARRARPRARASAGPPAGPGRSCRSLRHSSASGKVRDLYASATTDCCSSRRTGFSAFDVVLPTPIPDKGRVLTGLSRFWFARDRRRSCPTTSSRPTRRTCPTLAHRRGDAAVARPSSGAG